MSIATYFLQYVVDSRIDETFQEFLLDVLSGSSLPPNPFPELVSHLRRAAVRSVDVYTYSCPSLSDHLS